MSDTILLGQGRHMIPVPRLVWQTHASRSARHTSDVLSFMSADHHRVRNFAVAELPRAGAPLPPDMIAQRLALPVTRVNAILDDLEKHLTFVFRNEQGAVAWAYPVTADSTPHHATFSTGEVGHAA